MTLVFGGLVLTVNLISIIQSIALDNDHHFYYQTDFFVITHVNTISPEYMRNYVFLIVHYC